MRHPQSPWAAGSWSIRWTAGVSWAFSLSQSGSTISWRVMVSRVPRTRQRFWSFTRS